MLHLCPHVWKHDMISLCGVDIWVWQILCVHMVLKLVGGGPNLIFKPRESFYTIFGVGIRSLW